MVILIFIFLTPKSWFLSSELPLTSAHQSRVAQTVILSPQVVVNEADRAQIERQVKAVVGRDKIEVIDVRKVVDADGKPQRFEVDIR